LRRSPGALTDTLCELVDKFPGGPGELSFNIVAYYTPDNRPNHQQTVAEALSQEFAVWTVDCLSIGYNGGCPSAYCESTRAQKWRYPL